MKKLVGKVISKKVPFMGDEVEIRKLSVAEVLKVQGLVKVAAKSKMEDAQIGLLRDLSRLAVVGAAELSDEDFNTFPLQELNGLSTSILAYSGLGEESTEGN